LLEVLVRSILTHHWQDSCNVLDISGDQGVEFCLQPVDSESERNPRSFALGEQLELFFVVFARMAERVDLVVQVNKHSVLETDVIPATVNEVLLFM